MIKFFDDENRFIELFDPNTGFYIRSDVLDENGKETGKDPFMRKFPVLLDIGIMGACGNGLSGQCTVDCYQTGHDVKKSHISLENYKKIIDQSKGLTLEIALGGRGDPNLHPDFEEILKYTRDNGIVPNYTTSGLGLTDEHVEITKKYVGAVAVSAYFKDHTIKAVRKFIDAGIKTNIHFVLSNESIDTAIDIFENPEKHEWLNGIEAFVCLTFKPTGNGSGKNDKVLKYGDPKVEKFFNIVDNKKLPFKIGFDSCTNSHIATYMKKYNSSSVHACDSSLFSAYISPEMIMTPCSFDQAFLYGMNLNNISVKDAWNSLPFEKFRDLHKKGCKSACSSCSKHNDVCNPCPLTPEITVCPK